MCRLAWANDGRVHPRSQSSVAVSADGEQWFLLNASPDIRQQIWATPALQPRGDQRMSPIAGVMITNGDVDHVTGLLGLRERHALTIFGTRNTLDRIAENRIFGVLADDVVRRAPVAFDEPFEALPGLEVTIFSVPGKVPLWLEGETVDLAVEDGSTVGVDVTAGGARLVYIPGCAAVTDKVKARVAGADALLFDGTLHTDDEMIAEGVGSKTGRRMGHLPISGDGSSVAALAGVEVGRRIFIHLNNTNPVLIEGSAERLATEAAGWEVAYDGMEIAL